MTEQELIDRIEKLEKLNKYQKQRIDNLQDFIEELRIYLGRQDISYPCFTAYR